MLLVRVHPGDLHVAAERDRPDRVLGLAAPAARDQRREEQREALDAHADRLGRGEVPELVQDDQRGEAEEREQPSSCVHRLTSSPATVARLGVGVVERLEAVHAARAGRRSSVSSITVGDAQEGQPPAEERVDGDLVGGVEHARRRCRRPRAASRARRRQGNASSSGARRSASRPRRGRAAAPGRRRARGGAARRRSARACRGGRGGRARRRRRACTSAWTIDCGCTTTSMRSYGVPNRWWASMTSRPLFISVAESIVILPPIAQVGCLSACSTVDVLELGARAAAERAAGRGQRRAGRSCPARSPAMQLVQRRVLGVDRDDLRAGGLGQRRHELAADDQRLLVGQREVDALAERGDGRAEAGRADERVEHEVGARTRRRGATSPSGPASTSPSVHASAARAAASGSASAIRVDAVRARLLDERLQARVPAVSPTSSKLVGARDDVERLRADRARSSRG